MPHRTTSPRKPSGGLSADALDEVLLLLRSERDFAAAHEPTPEHDGKVYAYQNAIDLVRTTAGLPPDRLELYPDDECPQGPCDAAERNRRRAVAILRIRIAVRSTAAARMAVAEVAP